MKGVINLIAIIIQLLCLVAAGARFGFDAGLLVLAAIIANSVQAVLQK